MRSRRLHGVAILSLVFAAAASRLLPHPPNFTAVPAMALFSGAVLGRRWLAIALPLLAMLISDLALGATLYGTRVFASMLPVYSAITLVTLLATRRSFRSPGAGTIAGASVAATAVFYVVTNFAVWCTAGFYPMTLAGLLACYTAALPFAANMLLSTLLYTSGLFVLWRLVERRLPAPLPERP